MGPRGGRFASLVVVPLVMVLAAGFVQLFWVPLHWLVFFVGALVCHGQLAASRPSARHATAFYLAIALGGVLGGVFNALVAPMIFDRLIEYPLAIVPGLPGRAGVAGPIANGRAEPKARLSDLILPAVVFAITAILVSGGWKVADSVPGTVAMITASGLGIYACVTGLRRPVRFALTAGGVLLASSLATSPGGRLIHRERDFFGTIRVLHDAEANVHRLFHGNTLHGQQSLDPKNRDEPSTYFTRSGPIGQFFEALEPRLTRQWLAGRDRRPGCRNPRLLRPARPALVLLRDRCRRDPDRSRPALFHLSFRRAGARDQHRDRAWRRTAAAAGRSREWL